MQTRRKLLQVLSTSGVALLGAGQARAAHGVVDLYGRPKPSFQALRLQASPVESAILRKLDDNRYQIEIRTRQQLPAYALRGYSLRWVAYGYDDLPMNGRKTDLPALQPGSSQMYEVTFTITGIRRVAVDLVRPTGFSAITVEYLDQAATK